jgi:hypothetical protein
MYQISQSSLRSSFRNDMRFELTHLRINEVKCHSERSEESPEDHECIRFLNHPSVPHFEMTFVTFYIPLKLVECHSERSEESQHQ